MEAGYMIDTNPKTERISTLLGVLAARITKRIICDRFDIQIADGGYRINDALPDDQTVWRTFDGVWAGEEKDSHYWFRFDIQVPEEEGIYHLNFETSDNQWKWDDCDNPQMLVHIDGVPVQALDWNHRFVPVDGGHHEVCIYAHTGCWVNEVWADETRSFLLRVSLTETDPDIQGLYYDMKVPYEAAECMQEGRYEREKMLNLLNDALSIVDVREGSSYFKESVREARQFMKEQFYEGFCEKTDIRAFFTGHAHIDIAWLWPARQSREKAERTFTTMLTLMERYPQMQFFASSPVLYEWLKKNRPSLYEKIREKIREGRWEADCATFVEPDMNMPSGESLVRQFLYGKKFLKEEFDIDSRILWVPDCFGFAGTLPQIMRGCDVDQLITTKLGWNDTNRMPHDCFKWRGIDGSEVYAYFMTTQDVPLSDENGHRKSFTTYSSTATPSQTMGAWEGFREKELTSNVHIAFGFGDGGGGPSAEQIEYIERMGYGIPGIPTAQIGRIDAFVSQMQKDMDAQKEGCPKWDGELYFELHRGVYTSVAKNKKNNRRTEFLIHNAEWQKTAERALCKRAYPKEIFDECWKKILEYQFHDIIPGSSIKEAYDETDIGYEEIRKALGDMKKESDALFAGHMPQDGTIIWNHTPFTQTAPVQIDGRTVFVKDVPAYGYRYLEPQTKGGTISVTERSMENDRICVRFDERMYIVSYYDKTNRRELILEGTCANRLVVYDDIPTYFEAWEIRRQYRLKSYEVDDVSGVEIVKDGARSGLKVTRHYMDSVICQTIWMYEDSPMLEFETDIDWKCQRALLKAEFPIDINATQAVCDAPYGNVVRPMTQNTSWEQAKFEVCAHKFVDVSEGDYGVALINDCKYGYSFRERMMELTLLRTSKHPYPEADLCRHRMRYAFYPHEHAFSRSDVPKTAYVFNNPLIPQQVTGCDKHAPLQYSFVSCNQENVIVDTVKWAEDGSGVILRMYECQNRRTEVTLSLGFDAERAAECNMLEEEKETFACQNRTITCTMRPFEIKTLKIYMGEKG